jgi:hypothetical protein
MIVKVQLSITTTEKLPQVLVYNEGKHLHYQGPATKEIERALGGKLKKYFYATLLEGQFVIGKPAPEQDW